MHLIGSTILACVNLAAWLAIAALLFVRQDAVFPDLGGGAAVGLALALAFWLAVCVVAAAGYARRCARCLRCRRDRDYLAGLSLDLECVHGETRHQAFQTLADYCSQPLGWAGFWPFGSWAASQVERMRDLLTARFTAEADVGAEAAERTASTEDSATDEPAPRSVAEATGWLADVIKDSLLDWTPEDEESGPAVEPLPTMEPFRFVEALRGPAETALTSLAEAINAAPDALALRAVPDPCIEVLGNFLDEALKVGLKLRVEAALAGLHALQGPHPARRWKKHRAAAPPGAGPTRDWVKKFRRMKGD